LQYRSVAEHQLNRQSSRSHAIYTFHITRSKSAPSNSSNAKSGGGDDYSDAVQSKLHLVDLAGSERIEKSGSTGGLAKEAAHINRSLTFLEQVVVALTQSKRDHIPYRQSKLTYLLKDSLGGNCNTYLIACVWSSSLHSSETLSTLRFASRMKCIENNPIRNNLVAKDSSNSTRHLHNQIDNLRKELAMRDLVCGKVEPWLADLTRPQSVKACRALLQFLAAQPADGADGGAADAYPDIHSLAEARFMLSTGRSMLWQSCGHDEAKVAALTDDMSKKFLPSTSGAADRGRAAATPDRGAAEPAAASSASNAPVDDAASAAAQKEDLEKEHAVSFEEFKLTVGADVQGLYEGTRQDLKSAKVRQRELVREINSQKGQIDTLNELIQRYRQEQELGRISTEMPGMLVADKTIPLETYEESLPKIEAAKKAYREAHSELVNCKKEMDGLHLSKKKCLADVLGAYDAFSQERHLQASEAASPGADGDGDGESART
jgi:kinesin family protein 6/9